MHRFWLGAVCALVAFVSVGCAKKAVVRAPVAKTRFTKDQQAELKALLSDVVLRFDYDEAVLSDEALEQLQKVAAALRIRPWAAIRIEGHCDERGTEEYNLALGQRRAEAAQQYLLALGVHPDMLETISFGDLLPKVEGDTEEAWQHNRRDDLVPARNEFEDALASQ